MEMANEKWVSNPKILYSRADTSSHNNNKKEEEIENITFSFVFFSRNLYYVQNADKGNPCAHTIIIKIFSYFNGKNKKKSPE